METVIRKVENNRERYKELALEADPEEIVVKGYINQGDMFVLLENQKVMCEAIVIQVDTETCELKNLATSKEARGRGYATKMIEYLFKEYQKKYQRMIVGTSEEMIPFYVLRGFTKYHHTVKNFFIDNYTEEIRDNGFQCIDMHYYQKEF